MTSPSNTRSVDWNAILRHRSFSERDARARAFTLLDPATDATPTEMLSPFDRVESPWLPLQGVVPQSDDGVVIVRGMMNGNPVVVIAIEQAFQGGGIGEVSGTKIATALTLAADDNRRGTPTSAVLLIESGGVRLQEANLGLATVAEASAALLDLRQYHPVVALIAGPLGSFGGMSIVAGLCSTIIMTRESRLGLNGPEVIESEAGVAEFDSTDRAMIWAIDGGSSRVESGIAHTLVADDIDTVRNAVLEALTSDNTRPNLSEDLDFLSARLRANTPEAPAPAHTQAAAGRGRTWTAALAASRIQEPVPSLQRAQLPLRSGNAIALTIVPDPESPFHRARAGEVGLREGLALAREVRKIMADDSTTSRDRKTPIIAVVDLPSQAYGRLEEELGIHAYLAAAVDAYAAARTSGHPVVALVVGHALSGGFLAHGLQADRILALDDPSVEIHAMHKAAAARITRRTIEELDELATRIAPLSYDIRQWATLGLSEPLLSVANPNQPTRADVELVRYALSDAVDLARSGPHDLATRWGGAAATTTRAATVRVRTLMAQQWG